jgi:hypothetical protein
MVLDRALWISWYDLPDDGRDAYLNWAHETYMPGMLERPGFLWAAHFKSEETPIQSGVPAGAPGRLRHTDDPAVPEGNAYVLLFGAETPHAFAHPTPRKLHSALPPNDQKMLAMRVGERVNILIDEDRIGGPEAMKRKRTEALSPCIQLGSFNAGAADEDEILAWYAQWRLPSMNKLPGCVGIRKLVSVSGWAKHGVLYEFVSLEARNRHFPHHEKANPEMDAWTDKLVRNLLHAPGSPIVAVRIASAVAKKRPGDEGLEAAATV